MLIEVRIENLAVIEDISVRLGEGLTVFTGETGAGKSIIVGALSLLLGERASSESVRAGARRAVVEGVFDVSRVPDIDALLDSHGLDTDDGLLILRREVAAEGRSRAWINGAGATAGLVGEIGRALVDLHGQHEHQTLLRNDEQRAILDDWASSRDLAARTATAFRNVRDIAARLEALEARRRSIEQRTAELQRQAEEIENAAPREDEEEELESEAHRLAHAEELSRLASRLHASLYAAEDAVGARLDEARRTLAQLVRLDPSLEESSKQLDEAFHTLQELGRQMGEYASRVEDDPERMERVRRRQDLLFRLKARYGPTLANVMSHGRAARAELDELGASSLDESRLRAALDTARREHVRHSADLTVRRRKGAKRLDTEMNRLLPALAMPGGRFVTRLDPLDAPGAQGGESVEFLVSANPGFEPGPLVRVASGGELSRIMLALKAILARHDRLSTLIFDEIDAGIGGAAAVVVAERLRDVAKHHQVFVVTHLPQIAAIADHHLYVEKEERGGRASTTVSVLEKEDRVGEIARMLGGESDSGTGRAHARALLERRVD